MGVMGRYRREAADTKTTHVKYRRGRRILKYFFWSIICFLAVMIGAAFGYLAYAGDGSVGRAVMAYIRGETKPEVAFPGRDILTVLVLGADEDRDNRKRITNENARTDSIMLVRFDFRNHEITGVSIPRDTQVRIPDHGWGKINAAHVLGGPELAVRTVSQLLGDIPIDQVLVISYKSFEKAVDLMGGVQINVDKSLHYDDNWGDLHIHLEPGLQWLDGEQALGYVRYRHSDSDFKRIERQRQFMQALKSRIHDPRVWLQVPNIISEGLRHTRTTMDYTQLLALGQFGKETPDANIRIETLPVYDGRGTNLVVDRKRASDLLKELKFWEPDHLSYAN